MAQKYVADQDTLAVLARLRAAIKDAGSSLSQLERSAERLSLSDHETLKHGNLSRQLRGVDNRNLYLQTLLAICKLIDVHPAAVISGPVAGIAAEIAQHLPADAAHAWLEVGLAQLASNPNTTLHAAQLRHTMDQCRVNGTPSRPKKSDAERD